MGLRYVHRRWLAPGGWEGPGWAGEQVKRFERWVQRYATNLGPSGRKVKPGKGYPSLVSVWDEGRGVLCWYVARCGATERMLYAKCCAIFGQASLPDASGHDGNEMKDEELKSHE